jgi:hypothetical protein
MARRFVGEMSNQRRFPVVFAEPENGFFRSRFCFVVLWRTKHCGLAWGRRPDPKTGSMADLK